MKKYRNYLLVLIVVTLAVIIYSLFNRPQNTTLYKAAADFSVEDTASVNRIFIADRNGKTIDVKRTEKTWMVNDHYEARRYFITLLLTTLHDMTVKAPVSKSRYDNVIKFLATTGKKVEIYQGGDKPSKVFYVGTPNQNHTGTYMILEDSDRPYLVHIEGFRGFLTPRFSVLESDWKSNNIFKHKHDEISEINVEQPENPSKGFRIKNEGGRFQLYSHDEQLKAGWDEQRLNQYVKLYEELNFEAWKDTKEPSFVDSIRNETPLEIYSLTDIYGKTTSIKTYRKFDVDTRYVDPEPVEDIDRMYGIFNEEYLVVVQYYSFDPFNQEIDYFYSSGK